MTLPVGTPLCPYGIAYRRAYGVRMISPSEEEVREVQKGEAELTPNPQTPNPNPQTPNPKPQTPKPQTRNPEPGTLNPKPHTPNPKPRTQNPKRQTSNPSKLKLWRWGEGSALGIGGPFMIKINLYDS